MAERVLLVRVLHLYPFPEKRVPPSPRGLLPMMKRGDALDAVGPDDGIIACKKAVHVIGMSLLAPRGKRREGASLARETYEKKRKRSPIWFLMSGKSGLILEKNSLAADLLRFNGWKTTREGARVKFVRSFNNRGGDRHCPPTVKRWQSPKGTNSMR